MSLLLAIDPGPEVSGAVVVDTDETPPAVLWSNGEIANHELLQICRGTAISVDGSTPTVTLHKDTAEPLYPLTMAIEMPEGRGGIAGQSTFETCYIVGRFCEAWSAPHTRIYRRMVKKELTGLQNSKDSNVNQAIRDRYPRTGGGAKPEVGTKSQPGPLYGISKHAWAALALAITWQANENA